MPQIQPIVLVAPGRFGLNTEKENTLQQPQWCTQAVNAVVNQSGRLAARKGWEDQTTNAIATNPSIDVMFEYIRESGATTIISAANNLIFKDIDDFTDVANDITSSTSPSADNWQFHNFNDKCIGNQTGETMIVYTGTGDFTDITAASGTLPDGRCGTSAFGRLWMVDSDFQTIKYCGLLDETNWGGTGAGSIDMQNIWTMGTDEVMAISSLGSNLIVFGRRHIVFLTDGSGSSIGVTPDDLYVSDIIEGVGCIARDSVQQLGEGDIWFLSYKGVMSLQRALYEKTNPTTTVTANHRAYMVNYIQTERAADSTFATIRSAYSPQEALYLLLMPNAGVVVAIDTRQPVENEFGIVTYPVTDWVFSGTAPTAMVNRRSGVLLFGFNGVVGKYDGYLDNANTYNFSFYSPWLDLGDGNNYLKLLKEVAVIVEIGGTISSTWKWEYDFSGKTYTKAITTTGAGFAQFNISEFGTNGSVDPNNPNYTAGTDVSEFGGALNVQRKTFPGRGQGQFIRVGVTATINNAGFVLQQIQLLPKVARLSA